MNPLQTALSALLIVIIVLLVLAVLVPAGLERLARVNQAQRDRHAQELLVRRRDINRLEAALQPYRQTRSDAYRQARAAVVQQAQALADHLDALDGLLEAMQCPRIYGFLFPIQHFLSVPGDAGTILADSHRLRRARAELAAATRAANETRAALDELVGLPQRLTREQAALALSLLELESIIRQEREAGIVALDDLTDESRAARAQLERYRQLAVRNATIADWDAAAVALAAAAAVLGRATPRATELAGQRAALDEHINRTTANLDQIQAAKAGPGADEAAVKVRPLLLRAASLLNESAPAHRSRRQFSAAAAAVTLAARLVRAAHDLILAQRNGRTLLDRDDGATLHAPIVALREELAGLLDRLGPELRANGDIESLAGRATQLRQQSEALLAQQDKAIAQLEEAALATRNRLERLWNAAQQKLPLAGEDGLTRRYHRLLDDFQAAQRHPAELEKFRQNVAAFETTLEKWVTQVQEARSRLNRLGTRLPGLIDAALATAETWPCLKEDVRFIQQRMANLRTAQAQFAAVDQRHRAEALMEEFEAIENDIDARAAQIKDRDKRLRFLEDDVKQIVALSRGNVDELPAGHPDRARWDKVMEMIRHHLRSAHTATRYDDAAVALLRAAEVANRAGM